MSKGRVPGFDGGCVKRKVSGGRNNIPAGKRSARKPIRTVSAKEPLPDPLGSSRFPNLK